MVPSNCNCRVNNRSTKREEGEQEREEGEREREREKEREREEGERDQREIGRLMESNNSQVTGLFARGEASEAVHPPQTGLPLYRRKGSSIHVESDIEREGDEKSVYACSKPIFCASLKCMLGDSSAI